VNTDVNKTPEGNNKSSAQGLLVRFMGMNRLFLFTVVLPTLIAILYFGLIASDVYRSESRFVVRTPERQTSSSLVTLFKGTGFSRSQDDSYSVQEFILSRDALKVLNEKFNLKKSFTDPKVDIFSRFAGFDRDDSFEALHRYYREKIVGVGLDSVSSISTLTVGAFSAEDAFRVNQQLLEMSEAFVNQINERGRQDMIRFAASEVEVAENKAKTAALALSNYRNQKGVINPEQQSFLQLQQITKLQDALVATNAQLTQLQTFTANNPQIPALQQRVVNLRQEIDTETKRIVGGKSSLVEKAAEYQRLVLDGEFAEKRLASALSSLEQARSEAQRKQLYLERIAQPSKPDMAMEPRRIRGIFATLVVGLIAWGILTMLIAGIREHQD
jgi:capsular polysaccharide transport system permease protein